MLTIPNEHGYVTSDGKKAEYLGTGCCSDCVIFKVDDCIVSVEKNGRKYVRPYDFTIQNAVPPTQWINVYFNPLTKELKHGGVHEQGKEYAEHIVSVPNGFIYLETLEVKPKEKVDEK